MGYGNAHPTISTCSTPTGPTNAIYTGTIHTVITIMNTIIQAFQSAVHDSNEPSWIFQIGGACESTVGDKEVGVEHGRGVRELEPKIFSTAATAFESQGHLDNASANNARQIVPATHSSPIDTRPLPLTTTSRCTSTRTRTDSTNALRSYLECARSSSGHFESKKNRDLHIHQCDLGRISQMPRLKGFTYVMNSGQVPSCHFIRCSDGYGLAANALHIVPHLRKGQHDNIQLFGHRAAYLHHHATLLVGLQGGERGGWMDG